MTDEQAECTIRELHGIRLAIFLGAVVLAVFAGLKLGESFGSRDPSAGVQTELSAIRAELQMLRGELARRDQTNIVVPIGKATTDKPKGGS